MSSLYPSTLFHFTNKQGLWGILNETFILSYAREKIVGQNNKFREYAVPMVSFCDIKLADLNHFIKKKYGFYGIGLTKEWANRKGLNPVIYMNSNCELINNYIDGMSGMFNSIQSVNEIIDLDQFNSGIQNYNYLSNIYRYMKNYEGELIRKEKIVDTNYRFADEREWRYIPSMETNGVYSFVNISLIKTQEQKKEWNSKIRHIKLSFQPEDIKYLIVKNETDIPKLIKHIDFAKSPYDPQTIKKLSSRILTVDQILKDI